MKLSDAVKVIQRLLKRDNVSVSVNGDVKPENEGTAADSTLPFECEPLKPQDIYIPEPSEDISVNVRHIELTKEQAAAAGWHYKRKSRNRIRITRYSGTEELVTVPAMIGGSIVNEIGSGVFPDDNVRGIHIPDTVKKLKEGCFSRCTAREIVFGEGVRSIPQNAFYSCKFLERVVLPPTAEEIGERAFYGCETLKYINIPRHCCCVGAEAFRGSGLEGFSMPEMSGLYPTECTFDGSCFIGTPLLKKYKLICDGKSDILTVLSVGMFASVKFPDHCSVCLKKHSVLHCSLDLSECSRVEIAHDSFYRREEHYGNGTVSLFEPDCRIIMPLNGKRYCIPNYIKAFCPNGEKYEGEIFVKALTKTEITVYGSVFPEFIPTGSFAVRKNYVIRAEKGARFEEKALSDFMLETVSASGLYGEGELFSSRCTDLRRVVWDGKDIYIPPLRHTAVHSLLLSAFRGERIQGEYTFFDSSIIRRVFTEGHRGRRLTNKQKMMIAVCVLRSDPSFFPDRKIYEDFLKTHKRHFLKLCENGDFGGRFEEYGSFLRDFYSAEC